MDPGLGCDVPIYPGQLLQLHFSNFMTRENVERGGGQSLTLSANSFEPSQWANTATVVTPDIARCARYLSSTQTPPSP